MAPKIDFKKYLKARPVDSLLVKAYVCAKRNTHQLVDKLRYHPYAMCPIPT